jgi:hypothetical protein
MYDAARAMARLFYKDFLIVAGADFQRRTRSCVPIVPITWNADGKQEIHFITQANERHDNADDAVDFGLALGKAWIEEWLTRSK